MPPGPPLPPPCPPTIRRVPADSRFVSSILATLYPPPPPPLRQGIGSRPYAAASRIYSAAALSRNGFFFKIVKALPLPAASPPLPLCPPRAIPLHFFASRRVASRFATIQAEPRLRSGKKMFRIPREFAAISLPSLPIAFDRSFVAPKGRNGAQRVSPLVSRRACSGILVTKGESWRQTALFESARWRKKEKRRGEERSGSIGS